MRYIISKAHKNTKIALSRSVTANSSQHKGNSQVDKQLNVTMVPKLPANSALFWTLWLHFEHTSILIHDYWIILLCGFILYNGVLIMVIPKNTNRLLNLRYQILFVFN